MRALMRVAMLAALAWPCLPIAIRPGRTSPGRVSLRPLKLRLRGGGWQPTQVDSELLSALAASERGANSITSECFFENPGPRRRSLNPGMLEALRDFADMPMCNQSLFAFDRRVSLRALLVIVNGSADGSPVEPVGVQALAARCLHKLCITVQTTEELADLCRSRKVALDELVAVLKQPLQHEDPQIKWHLLDTMALLARDVPGTTLLQKHNAVPTVLRCLWDEDTDVVLRTGKVLANLATVQAGLGALFASEALQILMKALDDNQAHVRLRAMEVLLHVSAAGPQARGCFEALGIARMIEKALRSDQDLEVLNALEVAFALPIDKLSMSAVSGLLSDVVATWALGGALASQDVEPRADSPPPQQLASGGAELPESTGEDLLQRAVMRMQAMSILHERRLHAVARHWAMHASQVPSGDAQLFFVHLEELSEHDNSGMVALALSSLALVCSTPRGAALAQTHHTFSKHVDGLAAAFRSANSELLHAAMFLLRTLIRNGHPPHDLPCQLADTAPVSAQEEEAAGEACKRSVPAWVATVFARARTRLIKLAAAPFPDQRLMALSVFQEAVDAGGEAGVHLLFASPGGQEVAAVITAGPWSSSAPAESTVGRFVSPDEAAACEHKHSIARAAAKHQGALATCLGDDHGNDLAWELRNCLYFNDVVAEEIEAQEILELANRGPMALPTYSYAPARDAPRKRPPAVPRVATMYATR